MWGETEEKESIATIHAALDGGINLLDTAEGYGDGLSEEIVGKALRGRRDQAIVATKVGPNHYKPKDLRRSCEVSLNRLQTDRIDLYQLHWPDRVGIPVADVLEVLESLRGAGKIREWGVCNFGVPELGEMPTGHRCVSNQLAYSLLFRALEYAILPRCREFGIGVLVYSGLLHGILSGAYRSADEVPEGRARTRHFASDRPGARHGERGHEEVTFEAVAAIRGIAERSGRSMAELALGWLMAQPGITSILAGARKPSQAERNAAAGDLELEAGLIEELSRATEGVKQAMGPNPDMWQSPGRIRWSA
jgi:aryl-alcohol dehydrogenase-like predicted oxidoreductase